LQELQTLSGPSDRFTSTRQFFCFADFTIIAIFAVFAEIADLVEALFDRFTSTRRFFQFLAKIEIFAAASKPGHISKENNWKKHAGS